MRKAASGELVANACTRSSILQKPKIARKQFACFNKTALLKKKHTSIEKAMPQKSCVSWKLVFRTVSCKYQLFLKQKKITKYDEFTNEIFQNFK